MESDENSAAFTLARQIAAAVPGATVQRSDSHGPDAVTDPRLREQLAIISGRRLSQFSIAVNGLTLAFWGQVAGAASREIFIEHPAIQLALPGKPATTHAPDSDAVATALLSVLNQRVSKITVTGGQLAISFETGFTLKVDPDQRYESWKINSDDGLLIVCNPGGGLTIWYPRKLLDMPTSDIRASHLYRISPVYQMQQNQSWGVWKLNPYTSELAFNVTHSH